MVAPAAGDRSAIRGRRLQRVPDRDSEEAGLIRPLQNRLHAEQQAALVQEYVVGSSIKDLAAKFQVHRTTATAILSRAQVDMRQRGLTAEQTPQAALLYEQGWSLAKVGSHLGVNAETIRKTLRSVGVRMRSPHERRRRR